MGRFCEKGGGGEGVTLEYQEYEPRPWCNAMRLSPPLLWHASNNNSLTAGCGSKGHKGAFLLFLPFHAVNVYPPQIPKNGVV